MPDAVCGESGLAHRVQYDFKFQQLSLGGHWCRLLRRVSLVGFTGITITPRHVGFFVLPFCENEVSLFASSGAEKFETFEAGGVVNHMLAGAKRFSSSGPCPSGTVRAFILIMLMRHSLLCMQVSVNDI